jgi:hypothetical protein
MGDDVFYIGDEKSGVGVQFSFLPSSVMITFIRKDFHVSMLVDLLPGEHPIFSDMFEEIIRAIEDREAAKEGLKQKLPKPKSKEPKKGVLN